MASCQPLKRRNFTRVSITNDKAQLIKSDVNVLLRFIKGMPKAELHVHIEGTIEPAMMLKLAKRNNLTGNEGWKKNFEYNGNDEDWIEDQKKKRSNFENLQEFLDLYYKGCSVLKTEQDFYDIAFAYLTKASEENILHTEIFFDPQTHVIETQQLSLDTVINGLHEACKDAATKLNPPVDAHLIMCFLRHRHPESEILKQNPSIPPAESNEGMEIFKRVVDGGHLNKIIAVGLDSSEVGNPPSIFEREFSKAREYGLQCVAHAGEEGPTSNITDALDLLKTSRIDHGVRCLEEMDVVQRLVDNEIPLTVCPLSNHKLQVNKRFFAGKNPIRKLMSKGIKVTLNSDDPAYFAGYIDISGWKYDGYLNSCYLNAAMECLLTADELAELALNSFESSFLSTEEISKFVNLLMSYCEHFS